MNNVDVKIKVLKDGCLPIYQHKTDVCADCFANIDHEMILRAHSSVAIPLGFKLQLPANWKAVIYPRSGLARKNGIVCAHGEIDEGYIGEVGATLFNFSDEDFIVKSGDRICQIGFEPYYQAVFEKVDSLEDTDRMASGFGSTGL